MDGKSSHLIHDLLDEFKKVYTGKTMDALLPPLVFVITNNLLGLLWAAVIAIGVACIIFIVRRLRKETTQYSIVGMVMVGIASSLAFLSGSAVNFYLPSLLTNVFLLVVCFGSLGIKKPIAAYVSHLSRGWVLEWFWRDDIRPAYTEVTWFWSVFIMMRLGILWGLFQSNDLASLTWVSLLLGTPALILLLIVTYIYGITRLKKLKGPSVDEYQNASDAPWQGQKKGF